MDGEVDKEHDRAARSGIYKERGCRMKIQLTFFLIIHKFRSMACKPTCMVAWVRASASIAPKMESWRQEKLSSSTSFSLIISKLYMEQAFWYWYFNAFHRASCKSCVAHPCRTSA